ncbi:hypothetical protein D3C72_2440040 [compost metagenome]
MSSPNTIMSPRLPDAIMADILVSPPVRLEATISSSMLNLSLMVLANQPVWGPA